MGFAASGFLFAPWFGELTAAVVILLTYWLGAPGATREPWLRERGVNLEATRGQPRVWLVAHVDSKSQPISTAVRSLGVVLVAIALVGQFLVPWPADLYLSYVGVAGGGILLLASTGANSDGAADNASGVAAVLSAAALLSRDANVGVLITDAEELALAGASAWVEGRPSGIAINCDTVDDIGRLTVFRYGAAWRQLDPAVRKVVFAVDPQARIGRAPLGVLTDSNAFRRAHWTTVTLARGTIRTLSRIHTSRDSLEHLRGTGIPAAAAVLARLVEELS